jgi:hypothetical protein
VWESWTRASWCCMAAILYPQPAPDNDRPITFLSFKHTPVERVGQGVYQ